MICKGKARGAGGQLAAYLGDYLTHEKNEQVEVLEIKGSQFPDMNRSLCAWEAEAQRGKTTKALWHAQICPTKGETLTREQQLEAIDILERHLGLEGQPRVAVVHRNGEREHIHVVWSRIDRETGKAKSDKCSHRRNCDAAREMERRFGLYKIETPKFKNDPEMKAAFDRRERRQQSKAAPSYAEFKKAKDGGVDPREIRKVITGCWLASDSGKAFRVAMEDEGFILAHGDKRQHVIVDRAGHIHSLAKMIDGGRVKNVRARLKDIDPASIPKAVHVQQEIRAAVLEREEQQAPFRTRKSRQAQAPPDSSQPVAEQSTEEKPPKNHLDPKTILADMTERASTFTTSDLKREIEKRLEKAGKNDDPGDIVAAVRQLPDFVALGKDRADRPRYTSRDMLETELKMRDTADQLSQQKNHSVKPDIRESAPRAGLLNEEQRKAFDHVTGDQDITLVVGFAGTGKSYMLGAAREAWEAQGYRVRGCALSSMAASSLQEGSGIQSRTLMSTLWRIQNVQVDVQRLSSIDQRIAAIQGNGATQKLSRAALMAERDRTLSVMDAARLTQRDIIVLDEAAMVGSRQMMTLLTEAQKVGAKVVLVGDSEQLQAIDAGGAFRALHERHGAVEITGIRRQDEEWQKQATKDFAQSFTEDALGAYNSKGHVHKADTHTEARTAMIEAWKAARDKEPDKTRIMMAFTRLDVAELNAAAREVYRAEGQLTGQDHDITTEQGKRRFATGDRIYFLQNDLRLGVMNGSLGTLESVKPDPFQKLTATMTVRLDTGKMVKFSTEDYAKFSHGYAATVHKAQGATVDHAHLLASKYMDRHAAYVGMSRHRESVDLHYGADEFRNYSGLVRSLSRDRRKDTTLDYLQRAEKANKPERFWEKVRHFVAPSSEYEKAQRIRYRHEVLEAFGFGSKTTDEERAEKRLRDILRDRPEKKRHHGIYPSM